MLFRHGTNRCRFFFRALDVKCSRLRHFRIGARFVEQVKTFSGTSYTFGGKPTVHVRNLREGESATLPVELQNHGMFYLIPEWAWVVECDAYPAPFAIIVASQAHSWLVLYRILAISPLPPGVPLTWFMEALPQVFAEARLRGCVGFMTFLADNQPAEVKMARIITRLGKGGTLPFQGSIGAGMLEQRS